MRTFGPAAFAGLLLAATPAAALTITSTDISDGGAIADVQVQKDCKGKNISPAVSWSGVPKQAKSLAVTLWDKDVAGGYWHWVVFDIPVTATGLPSGAGNKKSKTLPPGAVIGANSYGDVEYSGPCPPAGQKPHHYQLTVWGLDVPVVDPMYGGNAIWFASYLHQHSVDKAVLTGVYGR
jgi:Raf kinase inhibitor-like YbhB/YbcL family protein